MPEGDTIHRLAAEVRRRVGGRRATWSTFRHPRLATLDVAGRTLTDATSHGKHLFLHWDDGWSLHIHLLMDGRVRFGGTVPVEEWRRRFEIVFEGPAGHDQGHDPGGDPGARYPVRMTGVDIPLLHRVRTAEVERSIDHLGPDLCGRFDQGHIETAVARLAVCDAGSAPLGGALLDQRNVAGFGNIYAVEVPFIVGLSPFCPVGDVAGLDQLVAIGAALIRTNARLGPQNTTGRRLERADHWVLSDRARTCARCGTAVRRLTGDETPWRRRTAWCPVCQPDSAATVDVDRARKLLALHPARRLLRFADDPSREPAVVFSGPPEPVEVVSGRRGHRHRRDRP